MKFSLPTAVTTRVARTVLVGKKNSPTILFGAGVVGVVATTITACRATLKLEEIVMDAQSNLYKAKKLDSPKYSEKDRQRDITLIYVQSAAKICKLYGPSFLMGAASIAALTGAHHIQNQRIAGLTAAYAVLDKGFQEYRKRVAEEFGEEKERELRFGSETYTKVVEDKNGPKKIKAKGPGGASQYARFFEEFNVNWSPTPEYNVMFLRGQQNYANQRLQSKGHVFLNEVYDSLGLERTPAGAVVGWVKGEGDDYVDFGIFNDASLTRFHDFVTGREGSILLDFNVDGVIYDKI